MEGQPNSRRWDLFAKEASVKAFRVRPPVLPLMFQHCKDTLHKGGVGLTKAMFEYQRLGYNISLPLVDAQGYDLVIEKDGVFKSVQCKATSYKRVNYEVPLRPFG